MLKKAKVLSQKPSSARKGLYITLLADGAGELKAYSTRKLAEGEEVVISVQQGAARDPLSVSILTDKQAKSVHLGDAQPELLTTPELTQDAVEKLVIDAFSALAPQYDYLGTDVLCFWLKEEQDLPTSTAIKKILYNKMRQAGYDTNTSGDLVVTAQNQDYGIRFSIDVFGDAPAPRVVIRMFKEN